MTMKERITLAVRERLCAAAESETKEEIIEELAGNIYAKYQDQVAAGTDPEEAYGAAMDSLGDVSELVALCGGPTSRAEFDRAVDMVITTVRGAVDGVVHAAQAAKEPLKNMGKSIVEGIKSLEVTVDVEDRHQFTYTVPAADVSGLELRLRSGDVVLRLWDEDVIQVIERSGRELDENRHASFLRREDGVLCVEQGSTAVGFAWFNFGSFSSDFEVFLPRRVWSSLTVYSTNGDVTFPDGLCVGDVLISSTNGDVDLARGAQIGSLSITSVNGDVEGEEARVQKLVLRSTSGDLDVALLEMPEVLDLKTVSGDLSVALPENDGFAVAYTQTSGSFDSSFELTTSLSRRSGVASYKGAQTPLYQFSAVSGDMDIRRG